MTNEGIAATDGNVEPGREREAADVKRWLKRVESARKYDEEYRKQIARDRRYARGDSGFLVDANIAGTNIDILESFLYSKDPDIDIVPAPQAEPPSVELIERAVKERVLNGQDGQMAAMAVDANPAVKGEAEALIGQRVSEEVEKVQTKYREKYADVRAFASTLEVIVSRLWHDAALKRHGRAWVRGALTVATGVLKASWQERTAPSPETTRAINDLQNDIARLRMMEKQLDGDERDNEALIAQYERELARLQQQPEPVVERGFVVDVVDAENWVVSPGVTYTNNLDAPWQAERIPMLKEDAISEFGLDDENAKRMTSYKPRKQKMGLDVTPAVDTTLRPEDADSYVTTATPNADLAEDSEEYVMVWEIWDRLGGCVLTAIEGYPYWVKKPWTPVATERFYPYFVILYNEVNGQRYPQSLIARTSKLLDEYSRIGTAEREHRKRAIPQVIFDAGQVESETVDKLTKGGVVGEWVGAKTVTGRPVNETFMQKPYPPIDASLYDRSRIMNEIERLWGVQEALSGAVSVSKTATEAEIQQTGFQARSGGRRDLLEEALGELARYTVEIARANVTQEDAIEIAGDDAYWPEYGGPDDLRSLLMVDIKAGSSGKPNTNADRQSWATLLPMLQQGVMQIGQLRGSSPQDIANSIAELLKMTVERTGDRIDIDQLMPQAGSAQTPQMPMGAPQ